MKTFIIILILAALGFFFRDKIVLLLNSSLESRIVKNNLDGEIDKCFLNDKVYYSVGQNAYDAGGAILDAQGTKAGVCNYGYGLVDPICGELNQCQTIYRVYPNIWGKPEVKYNP